MKEAKTNFSESKKDEGGAKKEETSPASANKGGGAAGSNKKPVSNFCVRVSGENEKNIWPIAGDLTRFERNISIGNKEIIRTPCRFLGERCGGKAIACPRDTVEIRAF